jgi:hypothetical protein
MTQWTEGEKGLSGAAEVCVMMRAFERQVTESEQRGLEGGRQGRTAHDTQRGTTYKTTESEDGRCVGWARALGAEITQDLEYILRSPCFVSFTRPGGESVAYLDMAMQRPGERSGWRRRCEDGEDTQKVNEWPF